MTVSINDRVKKYRNNMRALGLRPVQIWVPDTKKSDFSEACLKQSRLIADTEKNDQTLHSTIEDAWLDIEGWSA
jgi:hypothetical protein